MTLMQAEERGVVAVSRTPLAAWASPLTAASPFKGGGEEAGGGGKGGHSGT
jgi:hypothetical protein